MSILSNGGPRETLALIAYASAVEPDHVRDRREKRIMQDAFGDAIDERLAERARSRVSPGGSRYRPRQPPPLRRLP